MSPGITESICLCGKLSNRPSRRALLSILVKGDCLFRRSGIGVFTHAAYLMNLRGRPHKNSYYQVLI